MEHSGPNLYLYAATLSVNWLSFSVGSAYSWTSPVIPILHSNDSAINPLSAPITTFEESWLASLISLGAAIGSVASGPFRNRLGCKKTLMLFASPIFIAQLLYVFSTHINVYLMARFILGLGTGCVFSIIPSYVGEISEDKLRGSLGCIMSFFMVSGTLFGYVVGPFVDVKKLSFVNSVPIVLFYGTFGLFVPESPYYYVAIKDFENARASLKKFRKLSDNLITKELLYVTEYVQNSKASNSSIKDIFQSKAFTKGLFIGISLMIFQQFSGINAIVSYMQTIFDATGSDIPSHISVIIIGTVQVIVNGFTAILADRFGRRILLLISSTTLFISLMSLGTYFFLKDKGIDVDGIWWFPIKSLVLYIVGYNSGLSSLPWTITGELFSPDVKALATSITSFTCLLIAFITIMCFPHLAIITGMAGSFWLFGSICGIAFFYIYFFIPETKGKSFWEIQLLLEGNKK